MGRAVVEEQIAIMMKTRVRVRVEYGFEM